MAIDTINNLMSVQAISSPQATQITKPAAEYTDVSLPDSTPKVDATTQVVENTDVRNEAQNSDQKQPSNDTIKQAVDDLNKKMSNSEAVFGIHEGTNRITIKIVDKQSKKVIKELPPEKTLDMIAKVWELAGLLVDEKR